MSDIAKCPICSKYIDITFKADVCPKCGGNISTFDIQPETYKNYQGVGGWLLFLCISMTIISPLYNLLVILRTIAESNQISVYIPEFETAVKVELVITFILIALGVYAGISLWTVRPKAVLKAKIYLIALPILSIISIFSAVSILPEMVTEAIIKESILPLFRAVIYSVIWFLYLSLSQRVAETYNTDSD